jgi:hypothetical protein
VPPPLSKKTSSASLGSKLIFLRHQLGRDRSSNSAEGAACAPVRRKNESQTDLDDFAADWKEPTVARPRRPTKTIAPPTPSNPKIHLPPLVEQPRPCQPATSLTSPRHGKLPVPVGKKPQAPPHDPRIIGFIASGGSRVFRPLKHEARVQRNRAIFFAILCVITLLIAWALIAK